MFLPRPPLPQRPSPPKIPSRRPGVRRNNVTNAAGAPTLRPRSAASKAVKETAVLILLGVVAGGVRQFLPGGVRWTGRWPTADTSAEDAYKMMAHAGDPPFAS